MKFINTILFDTLPGIAAVTAFEYITGLGFEFKATGKRPSLVAIDPERMVISGAVCFVTALMTWRIFA